MAVDFQSLGLTRAQQQPLIGVKRKLWRKDDEHAEEGDRAMAAVRKNVLTRDNYTCQFCGHRSEKYLEVHHVDDNHQNNDEGNLITACSLCHQVHHLGMVMLRQSGFLAIVPELTQTEINNMCRNHFVFEFLHKKFETEKNDKPESPRKPGVFASAKQGSDGEMLKDMSEALKELYGVFEHRANQLPQALLSSDVDGATSKVLSLDYVVPLLSNDDDIYNHRFAIFENVRVIPTAPAFHVGELEYLSSGGNATFAPGNFKNFIPMLMRSIEHFSLFREA